MVNKQRLLRLSIFLLVAGIILLTISARGCPKRGRDRRVGSSNIPVFMINAPSNLTATVISTFEIRLSWQDNSNNEDGFEIERSIGGGTSAEGGSASGGNYELLTLTSANETSYSDTDVSFSPFSSYYYRIRAFNTIGDRSSYSNEVSVPSSLSPPEWAEITSGDNHNLARTTDGILWAWGLNDSGQLGLGDIINRNIPNPIQFDWDYKPFADITLFSAGGLYSIARKSDGTLWAWGVNGSGQLGFGDTASIEVPDQEITSATDWSIISAGGAHALAIKTNRTLWAWGLNNDLISGSGYGRLGVGDTNDRWTPAQVGTESDWSDVSGGSNHTITLKRDRTLWAWGWNYSGQLGLGDTGVDRITPTQIGSDSDWLVVSGTNLSKIAAGAYHTVVLKTNSTLWAWGYNLAGQLGDGTTDNRTTPRQIGTDSDWSEIAASRGPQARHTIALKTDNTLWAWGNNGAGQLGLGDTTNRNTPTQIGTNSDWSKIATGQFHTIALKTNNIIWVWGGNQYGQLGIGNTVNQIRPININLPQPGNLIATTITYTQITLSWSDNSLNEMGFIIERSISSTTGYSLIAAVSANTISYSDETVTSGNTYYYRVKATYPGGDSPYSNVAVGVTTL